MVSVDRFGQSPSFDESHRVEAAGLVFTADEVVNRNNAGVLQLAGQLGLTEETFPVPPCSDEVCFQFLQRDIPVENFVVCSPDLPDSAGRMQAPQRNLFMQLDRPGRDCGLE